MGPMIAANRFLSEIRRGGWPKPPNAVVSQVRVSLHGSLAYTGVGHGTERAVMLGLNGELPATVDLDAIDDIIAKIELERVVRPPGHSGYRFNPPTDLVLDRKTPLPGHANGMIFEALDSDRRSLLRRVYYSIGGGFVVDEQELSATRRNVHSALELPDVPFPFSTALEMLKMASESGMSIAEMKRQNELAHRTEKDLDAGLDEILSTMNACIDRGLESSGILTGGLNVTRRARAIYQGLANDRHTNVVNPVLANDWLAVYAMAVNEENAAGGRVVTAPTNGAAGVVPAVMRYASHFYEDLGQDALRTFLLTSAAIGGIIKHNASISGAEVGCQGEVGSASAMAAAGLAAILGGTPEQIENAAEIALEHHLGMTCDPIKGLVQIPCIERNAFGAVKAVTAASLALKGSGKHNVPLDACVETMRQTGLDMSEKYKETSLGGLAVNVPEC